ncbi:Fic family protein [Streptobacillus canis]|uniref:Fic family protein n=1 Tax=Streptobacillus canis TaxID=2678686 RepID=UPI0022AF4C72|nr:Fic family protein [Streptobacillus canis]
MKDFLSVHRLMMDELFKESGKFRSKDVAIYDAKGNILHIGCSPEFVNDLVLNLFRWGETAHPLIKSSIIHFELEIIHPFSAGNGRMGRIWQNLILLKWNKLFEWLPMETIVYENQIKYYEILERCNKANDSTEFIEFMLEIIYKSIKNYSKDIRKDNLLERLNEKEKEVLKVIDRYLKNNKEITNTKAAALVNKPLNTTRRYILKFVELGILEMSGENKNRVYFRK